MLLILQHNEEIPPGFLADAVDRAGIEATVVRLWEGGDVPAIDGWSGIVSLGGFMGAYDDAEHPWMSGEKELLRQAVEAGVPVLGICLGCQLLADALGGRSYLASEPEIVFAPVELSDDGTTDPVVKHMSSGVLMWHQDTWDPPPGATLLATSGRYPQAFRFGSAVGLQPHPEAGLELTTQWAHMPGGAAMLERTGTDPDALLGAIRADDPEPMSAQLFDAWLAEVAGTSAGT